MTQILEKTQMDEFERLLEESFSKSYSVADIVEGSVMRKESEGYLISVKGGKTEAFLPNKEVSSEEVVVSLLSVSETVVVSEEVSLSEGVSLTVVSSVVVVTSGVVTAGFSSRPSTIE